MKLLKNFIEAIIVLLLLFIFKKLSFNQASSLGMFLATKIGPKLKFNKNAYNNVKIAFPNYSEQQITKIVTGMWNNLGRSIGEFPHIFDLTKQQYNSLVKITGIENLKYLKKGCLIFSAHIGNWEIVPYIFRDLPISTAIVYRSASNKFTDNIINSYRKTNNLTFIPKGKKGAKQIIRELKSNNNVAMLVDQRMNDGMKVPFFSKDAMTAPAIASLALQYELPIIPLYCIRKNNKNHKFEIIIDKPIKLKNTSNREENIYNTMLQINKILESWIVKNPEQWFWIHNRWANKKTH